ncbi:hypothetical protein DER45DRAFT_632766 [Fusarium avenaceum]|nr:hypothetical protein DER45DRAFT_632766 [Fusarium avenaceum]
MPRFRYSPVLPLEIRLLELQAGASGGPLVGTIVHQVLSVEDDKIPDFEALSYCWGDQSHPDPITLINGQPADEEQSNQESETGFVNIGLNLASALRSLRYSSEKRIQDLAERSFQVRRMADIFHHARSYRYNLAATVDDRFVEVGRTYPLSFVQWRAFEQLLALDWHTRLWTYQEIVLANQATCVIWLGREEMPWTYSGNATQFIGRATACDTFEKYNIRLAAFRMTMHNQCSDSRDKIFALQGLMDPDVARSITPDYTKSHKELFTSICLEHLSRQKDLEFLNFCNASTSQTWVADLEGPLSYLPAIGQAAKFSEAQAYSDEPGVLNVSSIYWQPSQPLEESRRAMIEAIRALSKNGSVDDDDYLDKIIMALLYGYVWDDSVQRMEHPSTTSSLRSLQDWRERARQWLNGIFTNEGDEGTFWQSDNAFMSCRPKLYVTTDCSRTRTGSFARVPLAGRRGDIMAVLLGSDSPILLRPQEGVHTFSDHPEQSVIFYKRCFDIRIADPRLGNVPFPEGFGGGIYQEDGMPFFYQMMAGSQVRLYDDPRLSEAELKKRGVPDERFRLI